MHGKAVFFGLVRLAATALVAAALFATPAFCDAGRDIFFKEHIERIVKIPENGIIVNESVRPCPYTGKVAYVYEDDNGFKVCMNNACGPYVEAVARGMPVVSPDRNYWAAVVKKDGKSCVMLNGNAGRGYDKVAALGFSPDSMKVAYIAAEGDVFFVCVNQDRHPSFSLIDPEQGIVFTNNSKHLAYVVRKDKNTWCVVKDGAPGPAWEEIKLVTFSPDGTRLAYAARKNDQWHLVEGESASPGYTVIQRVVFSPDSASLVYIARSKDGAFMVINGKKQGVFEAVLGEPVFSPTGDRLAYSVREKSTFGKSRMRMVLDGKLGNPYDSIGAYLFSMDGKQFCYVASKGDDRQMVVHGDEEHDIHDAVGIPIFDPSGRHLAYAAKGGEKWHIVKDRKKGPAFDMVIRPSFSIQEDRMAYLAAEESLFVVVEGGTVLGKYPWAGELVFSPDGRYLAYGAARAGESMPMESFLAINGHEGSERFFNFLAGAPLVFTDHHTVAGIVLRDDPKEFWLIRATISEKKKSDG